MLGNAIAALIPVILTILTSSVAYSDGESGLDALSGTVVLLRQDSQELFEEKGQQYEVWLKDPRSGNYHPKINSTVGSAFFVSDEHNHLFLITAAHVASSLRGDSKAILRADLEKPVEIQLATLAGSIPNWHFHKTADVAVLLLSPPKEIRPLLTEHFIPLEMLQPKQSAPSREIPLIVLGFPLGLGVEGSFSPISKQTLAASGLIELPTPKLSTYFLLQDPSVGGFSGAPVFDMRGAILSGRTITMRGGGPRVVGLVSSTISDRTGGKFGAVVPSFVILDAVKSLH